MVRQDCKHFENYLNVTSFDCDLLSRMSHAFSNSVSAIFGSQVMMNIRKE